MTKFEPFREKMSRGEVCIGTAITFYDPAISESLAGDLDFVWIDAEHNALSLETIQLHLMAVRGTTTFPVVRVAWNDPVLLEAGARYRRSGRGCAADPHGRRREVGGLGLPLSARGNSRLSDRGGRARYGRDSGPEYCRQANESIMVNVQIEHAEAVKNLDAILATEGLSGMRDRPQRPGRLDGAHGPSDSS